MGVPDLFTCFLRNLYAGQEATVRTGHGKVDWFQIGMGYIKVVCCHSAYLTYMQIQFSSVSQSCLTLCDPMNRSTPGLPVHHQLLEFTQAHVQELLIPSKNLILCRPLLFLPSSFPASGSFQMNQLFTSGDQSIGVSASTSVLPMNTQG